MDLTYFISPLANPIHSQFIMQKVHKMLSRIVTSNKKQGLAVEDFLLKKKKQTKKKKTFLDVYKLGESHKAWNWAEVTSGKHFFLHGASGTPMLSLLFIISSCSLISNKKVCLCLTGDLIIPLFY
jgi:hypothetical protein